MSEILLFPGLSHAPDDIADQQDVLGLTALIARKGGPPRIRLAPAEPAAATRNPMPPPPPKFRIATLNRAASRSSRHPLAGAVGGDPPPHSCHRVGRRRFFFKHSPWRRTP